MYAGYIGQSVQLHYCSIILTASAVDKSEKCQTWACETIITLIRGTKSCLDLKT